jgi:hypothetical protein
MVGTCEEPISDIPFTVTVEARQQSEERCIRNAEQSIRDAPYIPLPSFGDRSNMTIRGVGPILYPPSYEGIRLRYRLTRGVEPAAYARR